MGCDLCNPFRVPHSDYAYAYIRRHFGRRPRLFNQYSEER